jgi:hypothetical protein
MHTSYANIAPPHVNSLLQDPIKNRPWGHTDLGSPRELTKMPQRLESVTTKYSGEIDEFAYTIHSPKWAEFFLGPWASGYSDGATEIKTVCVFTSRAP